MTQIVNKPFNLLAVLSAVFTIVFFPVGLILGAIALNQIDQTGERGKGLALAAVIVSGLLLILPITLIFITVAINGIR